MVECQKRAIDMGHLNMPSWLEDSLNGFAIEGLLLNPLDHTRPGLPEQPDDLCELFKVKGDGLGQTRDRTNLDSHEVTVIRNPNTDPRLSHDEVSMLTGSLLKGSSWFNRTPPE